MSSPYCYGDGATYRKRGYIDVCSHCGFAQDCFKLYQYHFKAADEGQKKMLRELAESKLPVKPDRKVKFYTDFSEPGKVVFRDVETNEIITLVDDTDLVD